MKVTLLSTSDTYGGAPIACLRLTEALQKSGVEARMLVQEKLSNHPAVTTIAATYWQKKAAFLRFVGERLYFLPFEQSKEVRFAFSPGKVGASINAHPSVQSADLLHLHWINFGFLSIRSLAELASLNKPLVWTMHDMWAFTGGCHYSGTCTNFLQHCHDCPFLRNPNPTDLSYRNFEQKKALFASAKFTLVACSEWLAALARQSALLRNFDIRAIPNPIDTNQYQSSNRSDARQLTNLPIRKKLILFGAMNTGDRRKGFAYLEEALSLLTENAQATREMELVVFGKANEQAFTHLPFPVHYLGSLAAEQLIPVYNAVDVFVLPSLEDNLPNTVMEAMACGTPVVAFRQGGLPEMIDHRKNGFLAVYRSAEDLAKGIAWLLFKANSDLMRWNARDKVMRNYAEEIVAAKYRKLYEELSATSEPGIP